jgi:hypothetical protein
MININDDLLFTEKIAIECCDYIWPNHGSSYDINYKSLNKGLGDENFHDVKPYSIIMVDLFWIYCMGNLNNIKVPFYILSFGYDYSVPFFSHNCDFRLIPLLENENLKKWFSVNVNFYHPKLVHIPICLPKYIPTTIVIGDTINHHMGWCIYHNYRPINEQIKNMNHNYFENFKRREKKLLYYKMSTINTQDHPYHQYKNIRQKALTYLQNNGFELNNNLVEWDVYMNELKEYTFCLSLPGKGIDCYRTWEALTLGVIPIVLNTGNMSLYDDLPVVIINNVEEITVQFLEFKYNEIIKNLDKYNFEKLTSSYWLNLIKRDISTEK